MNAANIRLIFRLKFKWLYKMSSLLKVKNKSSWNKYIYILYKLKQVRLSFYTQEQRC